MGPDHDHFIDLVRLDRDLIASAKGQAPVTDALRWLSGAKAPDSGGVIYLCADRRYFLSLLTCLASVFGQPVQSDAPVYVFLDSDVPPDWPPAIQTLAQRFGREVTIVSEADFVTEGVALKVELGFFAAGTGLSRAAYYRLYAARWLMALNRFSRALYVDTDIICRGDLTPLVTLDLGGAPLAARVEEEGPEVRAAATRNNIDPARYFNSGVLAMDFTHPRLGPGLARAIELSEKEPDRLIFHDQCALNIAFRAADLPPQWNFFLRPFRPQNGQVQDGILLHYLDRPKPWDITFWRNFREEWRVWALFLGQLLPPQVFTDMLAAANEV
nr:glycosyltransferase [Stagnihabitans tardus]